MKKMIFVFLFALLIYTRFVGLDWGLPYQMHPDERNMAAAIQSLNCEIRNCFNPHFFAYGQFPLYLGYLLIQIYHLIAQKLFTPISFTEAVMSLRVISALASILTVFILRQMMRFFNRELSLQSRVFFIFYFLFFIFQPYFIQFSHFGTTESLLMLCYISIVYYSLQLFNQLKWYSILTLSFISGFAIAIKISSAVFVLTPFLSLWMSKNTSKKRLLAALGMIAGVVFYTILFSPYNFISFTDFLNSMQYESSVAIGVTKVFYTRQFEHTVPVWFQLTKIFPYVLGIPQYIIAIAGFLFLSWKKKEINLLRFAFLVYFIPNSFLYTKWTRFMAPVFPIASVFALLFLFLVGNTTVSWCRNLKLQFKMKNYFLLLVYSFSFFIFTFLLFASGFAYLPIYKNPDVRFTASEWIYKNIPAHSYILSETSNVIDIPFQNQKSKIKNKKINYNYISFNFYELEGSVQLQKELKAHLEKADYIFVPSRRIFKNHPQEQYPRLNDYYQKLFSGELGFEKVAEFTSYPRIEIFGKTLIQFPDEDAEETWNVFDHPVVRIYKKLEVSISIHPRGVS